MLKYAVITNDLQIAAANKHAKRKKAVSEFLPMQITFLKSMRSLGIPVVHLQLIVPGDDPRNKGLKDEQLFTRGSIGSRILEEVYEHTDKIIEKPKDSGFFETKLDEFLKEQKVDAIVITGMQTQICVQTTAADAYFRGYKVYVPSDGVVSTRSEDTKRSLEWMANYCATVLTTDKIVGLVKSSLKKKND